MGKIIFVGGGTLGHVYPALPVIEAWKKRYPDDEIIYVACQKPQEQQLLQANENIKQTYFFPLRGIANKNIIQKIKVLLNIITDSKKMRNIIKKHPPQLVVGMGGSISGLFLRAAHKEKRPLIIHEQNSVIGKANKWSLKWAKYFLTAFPIKGVHPRQIWIGNPRFDVARKYCKTVKNTFNPKNILIISGTHGAKIINEVAINFLQHPSSKSYKTIIVTGGKYYDECIAKLGSNKSSHYQVLSYTDKMLDLMSWADVVISRAGGTTMFEILGLGKKMILIPSVNVSDHHQLANAKQFVNEQVALMIEEKDLTLEALTENIQKALALNSALPINSSFTKLTPTAEFIKAMEQVLKR